MSSRPLKHGRSASSVAQSHQSCSLNPSTQCLLYKRPMSCHSQYTDVEPPYDTEESFGSDPACTLYTNSLGRSLPNSPRP